MEDTVPLHFTLQLEGLTVQGSLKGWIHGVRHGMQWIIFHGLPASPPQRGGSKVDVLKPTL